MSIRVPDTKVTRGSAYRDAGDARYPEADFLKDEHPSGAIYLAGYLVECYLKWALCARSRVQYLQDLPDSELAERLTSGLGHSLDALSRETGYAVHLAGNGAAMRAFRFVAVWSPNVRYVRACGGRREAVQFMAAVRTLRDDIRQWAQAS